ncbi:hypothetical protein GCM10008931_35800 [Oceanobacillus oncorhynchi subsp. oncorhynchi]
MDDPELLFELLLLDELELELLEPFTFNVWPAIIKSDDKLLSDFNLDTVVPCWLAILERLSPDFTL